MNSKARCRKNGVLFAVLSLSVCFSGCGNIFDCPTSVDSRAAFSEISLKRAEIPKIYSVLILSDVHFGSSSSQRLEKIARMAETGSLPSESEILFCAVCGDVAERGSPAEYAEFAEFRMRLEKCGIEVFCVPGNHDVQDSAGNGENYLRYVGANTFYRIAAGERSFYFLDTADGTLGFRQLETLKTECPADSNRKIFFTHYPLYTESWYKMLNLRERAVLVQLLSASDTEYYFCGHTHRWETFRTGNFTEAVIGTLKNESGQKSGYAILSVNDTAGICAYRIHTLD